MSESLTDRLQQTRLMIVEVDRERGRLRVKGATCTDFVCHERTIVLTEEGALAGIEALYPGDIVRLEEEAAADGLAVAKVVVLRRVWEAIASPEI